MAALDAIILPAVAPLELAGLELHLIESVAAGRSAAVLLVTAAPGQMVSLGRYHLYGGEAVRGGIGAARRLTGGRAIGTGEGWLSVALIAPRVGALLSVRDAALKPEQVMNRYVRGLLGGLRVLGVDCFYGGRDAVTYDRREIAACAFEVAANGALLFEAALAVNRGMEELVHDIDHLDPDGDVHCPMYAPDNATMLVRVLGRDPGFAEIARAIVAGYGTFVGSVRERSLTPEERAHAERGAEMLGATRWLRLAAEPSSFNRMNRVAAQLGAVEARLDVADGFTIERLLLTGDIIANSPGVAELERALSGATLDLPSVARAVADTYGDGRNFILGLGELDNLVRLIAEAA